MKKIIIFCILIISELSLYSQNVELLFQTDSVRYYTKLINESPFGIYVDEKENVFEIMNGNYDGSTKFKISNSLRYETCNDIKSFWAICDIRIGDVVIGFSESILTLQKDSRIYATVRDIHSGISFILKKDSGYIVYYVNERGIPGAVDTKGKIYGNVEAIEYLKKYDPEKYEHSEKRAEELGLKEKFDLYEVLIWGDTYYSTTKIIESFYGRNDPYIKNGLIQYDRQGYGYQLSINYEKSYLCIVNPNGTRHKLEVVEGYKNLIKNEDSGISTSWYVGFGGNIYYYIAGKEYTEVFRIRRTWGNPDFYAMAVNGYTNDEYGKYVDEVLPKMSKADLRLLRNTIFALYGVHFKSEDLSKYFDKQVWYTDEGKTSGEVTLPAHRQKLVEMIQKLEK